jgi:hypothetical protein
MAWLLDDVLHDSFEVAAGSDGLDVRCLQFEVRAQASDPVRKRAGGDPGPRRPERKVGVIVDNSEGEELGTAHLRHRVDEAPTLRLRPRDGEASANHKGQVEQLGAHSTSWVPGWETFNPGTWRGPGELGEPVVSRWLCG